MSPRVTLLDGLVGHAAVSVGAVGVRSPSGIAQAPAWSAGAARAGAGPVAQAGHGHGHMSGSPSTSSCR